MTSLRSLLCLILAAPLLAAAQASIQPPPWRPPVISVQGQAQPIELRAVRIDTLVMGGQAQTRIELRLFNPNPRQLEGELQLPLLEGQVITGFALDVAGTLRDAVPVPKARGQEIFEDIRRRRVDPGLLEATAGNQYKLRVYPLPPQGERRVQLTITETLPVLDGRAQLRMPLVFSGPVGQLDVELRIPGVAPQAVAAKLLPAGAVLGGQGQDAALALHRSNWTAGAATGWLHLTLPVDAAGPQLLVGESGGKLFFNAQLPIKDEPVRRADPRHIALVWDASGSAAAQSRVLPVLDAYFHALRQPLQVSLLVVRNRVEPMRRFTVANGQWDELLAAIKAEPFDGSSNFDALPIPADVQATLLVSDGLATDGQRRFGYTHAAPLFAINGAASADLPRLARLAERSGGALVDATLASAEQGARQMLFHGWRIERITSLAARDLVSASRGVRNQQLQVAGELTELPAKVTLQLVHPDGRKRSMPVEFTGPAAASRWPAQRWAQWRSAELMDEPQLNQAQLTQIAAMHGLVGPNSSLIVLEAAADYARYELPAPADLADEVGRLRQQQLASATVQRQSHIEQMVRQFDERQRWWDRDFPKIARPAQDQRKDLAAVGQLAESNRVVEDSARGGAQRSASPRPAAPAAAAEPAMTATDRKQVAGTAAAAPGATIALQPWTPDAPYLRRLRDAAPTAMYAIYLDERSAQANSSAFYMDAADLFFQRGQPQLALRILSNLAEMNLENRQLLRLYGYRLVQAGHNPLAVPVFERVRDLAPNEPQSWRDLGLALADSGQAQRGVEALWEVVSRPWNGRFAGVNMIALAELNAIAARNGGLDLSRVDARLRRNLPLDLRVVMAWDTDDTDIDLWVTDPIGEKADYSHRLTHQGGAMSPDATGGYGPEEFALREAKPGKYLVQAQFYGHRQQVLSAGTTVMVRVTTGFGTPAAKEEWLTLRLTRGSETVRIGEVTVRAPTAPQ